MLLLVTMSRDDVTVRPHGQVTVSPCPAGHGSCMTISKDELVEICSGRPEAVDEDARGAAEAVGPLAATTACLDPHRLKRCCSARLRRHTGVAPQQLHRNMGRDAVTPRSENSAGLEAVPGAVRPERGLAPSRHCVLQLQEHRLRKGSVLVPSA
jgi:hypothetical protein